MIWVENNVLNINENRTIETCGAGVGMAMGMSEMKKLRNGRNRCDNSIEMESEEKYGKQSVK